MKFDPNVCARTGRVLHPVRVAMRAELSPRHFEPWDDRVPPTWDETAHTSFPRQSSARALTQRARNRIVGLRKIEALSLRTRDNPLDAADDATLVALRGLYPVSYLAIQRELRGQLGVSLVAFAEGGELGLWASAGR